MIDTHREHVESEPRRIIVLGSTGSVGCQTLEVIAHLQETGHAVELVGLAAGSNEELLIAQAGQFDVQHTALAGRSDSKQTYSGPDAAEELVRNVDADLVVAAIVGAAGLPATLAAVELGRDIALANKETLVAAGELVVPLARTNGVEIRPVDSEHAALWLCLQNVESHCIPPFQTNHIVAQAVITASGGPFRDWSIERMAATTPEHALAHPTWSMGTKISIDSATLMNKAFELIEAHWLFGLEPDRLGVLVHPQSIVHAMVELADGSVLTQMGDPDMRTPIQQAIMSPYRPAGVSRKLDLAAIGSLTFESPDESRFPAMTLWKTVIEQGGTAGAVVNAANEAAIAAFLDRQLGFCDIASTARQALEEVGVSKLRSIDDVFEADQQARHFVQSCIGQSDTAPSSARGRTR